MHQVIWETRDYKKKSKKHMYKIRAKNIIIVSLPESSHFHLKTYFFNTITFWMCSSSNRIEYTFKCKLPSYCSLNKNQSTLKIKKGYWNSYALETIQEHFNK